MKSALTVCPDCQHPEGVKMAWGPSITEGQKTITVIMYPCSKCGKLFDFDKMVAEQEEFKKRRREGNGNA